MRRFYHLLLSIALCATISTFSASIEAQSKLSVPVNNFRPSASTRSAIVTETPLILDHLAPSAQLLFNYANKPLRLVDVDGGERSSNIIEHRVGAHVMMSLGFINYLELGIVAPIVIYQGGDSLERLNYSGSAELSPAFGDLTIIPKIRFVSAKDDVANLGIAVPITAPTGSNENFFGHDSLTVTPKLLLSFETKWIGIGFNFGYQYRKNDDVDLGTDQGTIKFGHEVMGSAAVKLHVWQDHMDLIADAWASMNLDEQDEEEIPVEILGGTRWYLPKGFIINAGGGAGLTQGIGAPVFRTFLGVGYQHPRDRDPDKDGILNPNDKCPEVPEDIDGFEDHDGCPDNDNDNDGIIDLDDKCPVDAEDKDNFEDEDGCPDPDNDKDEVLDVEDDCPDDPEDKDTFKDEDGCPDPDNDEDGLLDGDDKCPVDAEDKDTFEDEDGCPDTDNDKDEVLDVNDKCPLEPEDKDEFEDADGCPDPDNDQDGILDEKDKCPLEPEVVNNYKDDDGCPDEGKSKVKISKGKIKTPPLFFATNKDRILKKSYPTLNLIVAAFRNNPWVKRVRIEGHTDERGSDDFNLDLSERRAKSVMKYLVNAGIDASRLEAVGFGETKPIFSNRTRKGRAKNRRVEFIILDPPMTRKETGSMGD